MPDRDMHERQSRRGPSDEFQLPELNREMLPGVMEAGKKGAGGGAKVENWQKFVDAANKLSEGKARHGLYEQARQALTSELSKAVVRGNDKRITEIAEKLDEVYRLMEGTPEQRPSVPSAPSTVASVVAETVAGVAPVTPNIPSEAKPRVEIPKDEKKLRVFLRNRIREIIRLTTDDGALNVKAVRDEVIRGLGFDPKTYTPTELFPEELGARREEVVAEVEAEIAARCLLREAELKEFSYKAMADKGAALNRFMNDMKGSESGAASAAVLDRDTLLWLKELEDLGDGLSREKVDRAFAIFVMLGEKEPDFSDSWARPFEKYRPKKRKSDGTEDWGTNYYDPSYERGMKTRALAEIEGVFGKDATGLAWQMFQAFKEEGNYNWQHFLSRDFTFAGNRHALATMLTPPVYIGSRRVYETKTGTFRDELERVSLSPLRVKTKVGEEPDPSPDDPSKKKDRLERDIFLKRAIRGGFLGETPFEDQNVVKEGRFPQQLSFNTIKDGEKFRAAVVSIGELGKDADKSTKIGAAIGALVDLRSYGQSLVEVDVISQDELDKQIEIEARNIIWELSIENRNNIQDLAVQAMGKQNFLAPSALNNLFQAMGGRTRDGYFLIGSNEAYRRLKDILLEVRSSSWEIFEDLEGEDEAVADKEKHAKDFVELPTERGNPLVDQIGKINAFMTKRVARPASKIISPLAGILFPESVFGKRKKK